VSETCGEKPSKELYETPKSVASTLEWYPNPNVLEAGKELNPARKMNESLVLYSIPPAVCGRLLEGFLTSPMNFSLSEKV
jgi:hypothetical protein